MLSSFFDGYRNKFKDWLRLHLTGADNRMNVFDIIGPVMVGPSSSHTAGAVKIGRIARELLGEPVVKADVLLHGSFARTGKGHGTDKAIIAGLLGLTPDDERIKDSTRMAAECGLKFTLATGELENAHPNSALISLTGISGRQLVVQGSSIGGGSIVITKINDMDVAFTGEFNTLVIKHDDSPGVIAAVTNLLAENGINIGNMKDYRSAKGGNAIMVIETDQETGSALENALQDTPKINRVTIIRPIRWR